MPGGVRLLYKEKQPESTIEYAIRVTVKSSLLKCLLRSPILKLLIIPNFIFKFKKDCLTERVYL